MAKATHGQLDLGDDACDCLPGFEHHPAYFNRLQQSSLIETLRGILREAPLFVPTMPRTGKPLSVRMSNCGDLGWLTDKENGYRYQATHPVTGEAWPAIPDALLELWTDVAGADALPPEACLINWYEPTAKMGLHVDRDEETFDAPVVSVSLGDDAWFRIGGLKRKDKTQRLLLKSGDVVVLGGQARLAYHGVDRVIGKSCDLLPSGGRINLTLRRVT